MDSQRSGCSMKDQTVEKDGKELGTMQNEEQNFERNENQYPQSA